MGGAGGEGGGGGDATAKHKHAFVESHETPVLGATFKKSCTDASTSPPPPASDAMLDEEPVVLTKHPDGSVAIVIMSAVVSARESAVAAALHVGTEGSWCPGAQVPSVASAYEGCCGMARSRPAPGPLARVSTFVFLQSI